VSLSLRRFLPLTRRPLVTTLQKIEPRAISADRFAKFIFIKALFGRLKADLGIAK
jgi:hypothetical protein